MSCARSAPPGVEDILRSLGEALAARGTSHGTLVLSCPPQLHARSTIYFVADGDEPGRACRWVIKRPDESAAQDDLANPVRAEQQFEALQVLATHFATVAPKLRVPRPVAYLSSVGALAMEYVHGTGLDRLVRPASLFRPQRLLRGIVLSGKFLRHLHALEPQGSKMLSPHGLAYELLALAEARMRPAGLVVPAVVLDVLQNVTATEHATAAVRLHGDFAPVNMLLDGRSSVTGLDVSLTDMGLPEDDLARFLMMLVTERLFLLSPDTARARALRDTAQATLLEAYAGDARTSPFLELHFIRQLCLRWLRKHTARMARGPSLSGLRKRVVDRYFQLLLRERADRLAEATRVSVQPRPRAAA
ncbi:MAG: aminoglycoside phosphotransferase family protein [Thermoleophilaceae bacterium]|nr:aminoglycoside phosphotransferase family protein [Thermoleophilaceae bacterium]